MTPLVATLTANAPDTALRPGRVHVWRFPCLETPAPEAARLAALVSDEEAQASRRFVEPAHRERYLLQRAVVRLLLAPYVGVRPRELRFRRGARGKPFLVDAGRLEFSLSHTDDAALLAVAEGFGVGVDLERVDADLDPATLGRVVLAPDEAALVAVPAPERRRAFLRIWCRKEACLKAVGVGLLDDLTALSVAADRVELQRCRDPLLARAGAAAVHVQDLAVGDAHAAALATTAPCAPMIDGVIRQVRLDGDAIAAEPDQSGVAP